MKKLTQAIFKDAPDWVQSAAVDSDGEAYWYSIKKSALILSPRKEWWSYRHIDGATCDLVGFEYDTTNWRLTAIDREY